MGAVVLDAVSNFIGHLPDFALTGMPLVFFGLIIYLLWRTVALMPRVKPKQIEPESASSVRWQDVAGLREAKEEMLEIVDFLREPGRFGKLGARVPKGMLLYGPPDSCATAFASSVFPV